MHNLESVPPVYGDSPALEEEILSFWQESDAFDKLRKLRADKPLFRFVDGPITANNPMGVHHAWGRTLKDVFLRYKAAEAGEIDWRPTETIPEDFYTF